MFNNYMKMAFRNIKRNKVFSLINILGLSVGMACCIVLLLWIQDELSYDRFHKNADNIYRVEAKLNFGGKESIWEYTQDCLKDALIQDFPEIKKAIRMKKGYRVSIKYKEEFFYEKYLIYASPEFFDFFSFELKEGNKNSVLEDPHAIIISESMHKKYFGDENPIGKTMILNKNYSFTVKGILYDIPHNSHLKLDFIAPFKILESMREPLNNWGRYDFLTYIQLPKDMDYKVFESKITDYLKRHQKESTTKLLLQPLTGIHLFSANSEGDVTYIYIFSLIGLVVLIIACINFVNLSTARSALRSKEIGVRKVSGARRSDLIKQLLSESILLSLFSFLISLLLVALFLPLFNNLSAKEVSFLNLLNPYVIFGLSSIVILTGIISGSYPAFYLSSFQPVKVLKSSLLHGLKGSFIRKTLVVLQFGFSIAFIIGAIVIQSQVSYMRNKKLGFDKDHVIYINQNKETSAKLDVLKTKLLQQPTILQVAYAGQIPVELGNYSYLENWSVVFPSKFSKEEKTTDKSILVYNMEIDEDFIDLMNFELISGRKMSKESISNAMIVNEEAVRQFGMIYPIGKKINRGDKEYEIIGVIKNFHFRRLNEEIKPLLMINDKQSYMYGYIYLKIDPRNIASTIDNVRSIFKETAPSYPFEYAFLDEKIDSLYRTEMRRGGLVNSFTFLTIFTSCLGLFGLSAFTAQNKSKEIGIRKVLGASVHSIVMLLAKELLILVLLANIISWPLAYYSMNKWLENYVYKIDMNIVKFLGAALIALVIALSTISYHALKAANENPVDSMRDE